MVPVSCIQDTMQAAATASQAVGLDPFRWAVVYQSNVSIPTGIDEDLFIATLAADCMAAMNG